jgi:hypothetical protein
MYTLRLVPGLGSDEEMVRAKAGVVAESSGTVAGFALQDDAAFNCAFTMIWVHAGVQYPSDVLGAKYAPEMTGGLNLWTQEPCGYFPKPINPGSQELQPLAPGDTVWMFMYVRAGLDLEDGHRFTYDPGTSSYARFNARGSTANPQLAFTGTGSSFPGLSHYDRQPSSLDVTR